MDGRKELNCPDDLVVTRYIDGDLPAGERAEVDEHKSRCHACAERIGIHRSLMDLVGPAEEIPLPPSLLGELTAIPDRVPTRPRGALYALAAAGAAAALLLLLMRGPKPAEDDPVALDPPSLRSRVAAALMVPTAQSALWLSDMGDAARIPLQRIALDEDPRQAGAAIGMLEILGRRETLPTLLRALDLPDRRSEALRALAVFAEPRTVPRIASLLESDAWREPAVEALVAIGGPRATRALARAARECEEEKAKALVAALVALDGRLGTEALLALLERPGLSPTILDGIARHADAFAPHLADIAGGKDDRTAMVALEILERMATPEAVGPIERLLSDHDRRVSAVRILVRVGNREAGAALLSRPLDEEMRAELASAGPEVIAAFLYRAEHGRAAERGRAVELLAELGTKTAVDALMALAERNRNMEARVRRALRRRNLEADLDPPHAEPPRTGRRASGIH